jgi:GT2 family glycosyltransferase
MSTPQVGVVLLTMGRRPEELLRAVHSVLDQIDVECSVIVVGNGWEPVGLPSSVRTLALPTNLGIPAGRNAGAKLLDESLLFFLDDDAWLPSTTTLRALIDRLNGDRALIQPRVVDPSGRPAPGRWVPRLRAGDPAQPGPATSLWEGATLIRRDAFDAAGGWPDEFFYAHEGIDLVWRVWDYGTSAWYAGDVIVHHPVIDPARHDVYWRMNARNRVWLARRNLPLVLEPCYVSTWVAITLLRVRQPHALRAWFAGLWEGLRVRPAGRRAMRWSTVWRMTRAGRPPVI